MYRLHSEKSDFCSLTKYLIFEGRLEWHKDVTGTKYETVHLDADSVSPWGVVRFWDEGDFGLVISCFLFLLAYPITVFKNSRNKSVYHA